MSDLVTLTNASKLVSKNPSTLRRLINEGKISSIKTKDGHHQIRRSDLIAYFATISDQRSQQMIPTSDQGTLFLQSLSDQISLLKSIVDRGQRENESLRDQNKTLQTELIKINYELSSFLKKESGLTSWIRTLRK